MSQRIEIRPTGTNGNPGRSAWLVDDDGAPLAELPATYEREQTPHGPQRYAVVNLDAFEPLRPKDRLP